MASTQTELESEAVPRTLEVTPLRIALGLGGCAVVALPFADLTMTSRSPWPAAAGILSGFLHPDFSAVESLGQASLLTMAFAFCGLAGGLVAGTVLALTGLIALAGFPAAMSCFAGRAGAAAGYVGLVVGRSTPEYILAYLAPQMFGPSMLPAIIALSLHNAAIIADPIGRQGDLIVRTLHAGAPRGFNLYSYEMLPRLFGPFLALCLYRWEIILRESAILGILGVKTLGFHIDSAISKIRLDRAMILIAATALLTIAADALSRVLRARLKMTTMPATWDR